MRNTWGWVAIVVLFGVIVVSLGGRNGSGSGAVAVGAPAPEITGADADGKSMQLSEFHGKVVAIDFWATWCPPCVAMMPAELALARRMAGRPFVLVGVSLDTDREALHKFTMARSIPWRNWFGSGSAIAQQWGVTGIPTVFLIDAGGVIRYSGRDIETIDAEVERLVGEAEKGKRSS